MKISDFRILSSWIVKCKPALSKLGSSLVNSYIVRLGKVSLVLNIGKSSLTRNCNLPTFAANETITNLRKYELTKEESYLLKAALYSSIKPDKIRKFEIFTTFEKIHSSLLNNLKSEGTKGKTKAHLSYVASS